MIQTNNKRIVPPEISKDDIIQAMKAVKGYIDITPGDFKQIYQVAYATAIKRILNTVTATHLMTKRVVTVNQAMILSEAAALLADKQVSGVPVVNDEQKLVGVVSEKDFLIEMGGGVLPSFMQIVTHCLHSKACLANNLEKRTVADIMTKPPILGSPEMTIRSISTIFTEKKINRIPIIDGEEQIVGIVTRTDLAQAYHVFTEGQ